jgi:hypothetical protein
MNARLTQPMMATAASGAESRASSADNAAQYLTFVCAGEEYGVEILRVQEIKGWDHVTRVPYAPAYVLGVMNLRGMIVPVLDLRTRLNLQRRGFDASTVVIVVRVQSSRGEDGRDSRGRGIRRLQHRGRGHQARSGCRRRCRCRLRQGYRYGRRQDGHDA